jgi:hypothetical protein
MVPVEVVDVLADCFIILDGLMGGRHPRFRFGELHQTWGGGQDTGNARIPSSELYGSLSEIPPKLFISQLKN